MTGVGFATSPTPPHLTLSGEIDFSIAPDLREVGPGLAASVAPGRLVVDLGDVTFIDSSGLGALVALRNTADARGATLVLVHLRPAITRFFEIAGVTGSFQVE